MAGRAAALQCDGAQLSAVWGFAPGWISRSALEKIFICSCAAALGLWLDGIAAWISLQGLCAGGAAGILSLFSFHLSVTPFTSLLMLAAMLLHDASRAPGARDKKFARFAARAAALMLSYILMMASMMMGQVAVTAIGATPDAMVLGAFLGATSFTLASSAASRGSANILARRGVSIAAQHGLQLRQITGGSLRPADGACCRRLDRRSFLTFSEAPTPALKMD